MNILVDTLLLGELRKRSSIYFGCHRTAAAQGCAPAGTQRGPEHQDKRGSSRRGTLLTR
jgi:hypothetical protein